MPQIKIFVFAQQSFAPLLYNCNSEFRLLFRKGIGRAMVQTMTLCSVVRSTYTLAICFYIYIYIVARNWLQRTNGDHDTHHYGSDSLWRLAGKARCQVFIQHVLLL